MQDKKYFIATKLAKKEIGFRDVEDKDNQDKLKILQFKISESLEQIEIFTNKSIKGMLTNNPNLDINELETGIVFSLERKMFEGKITTLEDIKSPEVLNAIQVEVMASNKYYVSNEIITEQAADSAIVGSIAGMTFAEFIGKDMSQEEIVEFEKQFKNSIEYRKATITSMDNLFDGKTQEEKEKAATVVGLRNKGIPSRNYRIQNKGTNADRATIMLISRMAATGEQELIKEAIIEAKLAGFEKLVNEDGTINFDEAYIAMLGTIGENDRLRERFATREDFIREVESANSRGSKHAQQEYETCRETYSAMKTDEDKIQYINQKDMQKTRTRELVAELNRSIKDKYSDKISTVMQEFYKINPDKAKTVLLSFASKENTSIDVKGQIIEFVNERFASKEDRDISNPLPKQNVEPKVSEGPDWGDR